MRPKHLTYAPTASDPDGISLAQTTEGAGNLTITGVLASGGVATMDIPRRVSITSNHDASALTFTVTGTDRYGSALTENIVCPNTATVNGTKNFKTVTTVYTNGIIVGAMSVGTADAFESTIIPVGRFTVLSHSVRLSSGAHLTHNVQYTIENPFNANFDEYAANWETSGGEQNGNFSSNIGFPVGAIRLSVTDYVDGSIASFDIVQV